jgi:ABC-type oligopeptide transport system ATPase subunit
MVISNQQADLPLLEIRELCMRFPKQRTRAVDHVSLRIHAGRTVGLVGASGAGKSSLARVIMQLARPDSGSIRFRGRRIDEMDARQMADYRQSVQMVFQDPSASLSPRRTIEQTLLEPLVHFGIGNKHTRLARIRKTLHTVGLDETVLKRFPRQFSTGQQQRIAIARALLTEPHVLIADEAVSSLDVSVQAQILQLLQALRTTLGITLLFISHDLAVVEQLADEVAVMYRGQLLEQCPASCFFAGPAHPYSRALLAFADPGRADDPGAVQWRLQSGRDASGGDPRCIFVDYCPQRMPACQRLEPRNNRVQIEKHGTFGEHCVKCHLYDETRNDEPFESPA